MSETHLVSGGADGHVVHGDVPVAREDGQVHHASLRHEESVERVAVVKWQTLACFDVGQLDP